MRDTTDFTNSDSSYLRPSRPTTEAVTYFMDDPREAGRLEAKVHARAWAERYVREHLFPGANVIEVGCGPGHLLRGAADVQPGITGTGVDISEQRVAEGQRRSTGHPGLQYVAASSQKLPLPNAQYDVAWCRHLLEYLSYRQRVVGELFRVLRPGGTVVLQDLDGQFVWNYPEDQELKNNITLVLAALGSTGFDPFVGRKLYHMALAAGFRDLRVAVEPYHLYAGTINDEHYEQWALKLDILRPKLVKLLGEIEADEMVTRFLAYLQDPTTLSYSILFTVTGRK
jgi:SAM-dependent methyltransferase